MQDNPYPVLTRLVAEMAADNGAQLRPDIQWPPTAANLEYRAQRLNLDDVDDPDRYSESYNNEVFLMACGDADDIDLLVERKDLQDLNTFLNSVFEGPLSKDFFAE